MWLAIDTSGMSSSVAVGDPATGQVAAEVNVRRRRTHSEQLMEHIDTVLHLAGVEGKSLTGIAVSTGPGSFTGLRIGLATAKVLAYTWQIPIVGVDTLTAYMYQYQNVDLRICPLIDAQKGNVYYALAKWKDGQLIRERETEVISLRELAETLANSEDASFCVGEQAAWLRKELPQMQGQVQIVADQHAPLRASSLLPAAYLHWQEQGSDDVFSLIPNYIRRSEAEVLWEQRQQKK